MTGFSFGDTRFIDPGITGVALITTVLFLALCDYATHLLEEFFGHSTTYMTMLQKIYKELMVMGLVSFCLVMYQATHPHNSDKVEVWIGTFDFVGYVLFFHAIFTVIHASSIIFWSMMTSREYTRFHLTPIADVSLGIEFLKQSSFYRFFYEWDYFPFLSSRQIAEFKVIHVLFRNTFGVPLDFRFGEYLGKCFERYSLNIIKLSITSWIVMFILYGLNLIRILSPYAHSFRCSRNHADDKVERSGNDDNDDPPAFQSSDCDLSYLRMFVLCSVGLEIYVVIIFMIGRVYTLKLLQKAGVSEINRSEDDLGYFLDEEAAREHEYLQAQQISLSVSPTPAGPNESVPLLKKKSQKRKMTMNTFTNLIEKAKSTKSKSNFRQSKVHSGDVDEDLDYPMKRPAKFQVVANFQSFRKGTSVLSQEENIFTVARKIEDHKKRKRTLEFLNIGRQRSNELKLAEDFSDIYFLHSPTLYFRAVEIGIVLNCIYLSLWVSDFMHIALNLRESSEYYQLVMAVPFFALIPLLTQTVKTASLLAAIAALEVDVIAEVLEESEERAYLIQDLRNRIIQRTAGRGLQQRELLESVFKEIDTDGSGEINRAEFKSLLLQMDMGYSGKKFSKLYNAIDRNGDGSLSLAELNHLLFPQDAKQKEVEELGLKIQSRLDRRINALETEHLAESDSVPLGVHKKRLHQISSLKSHLKSSILPDLSSHSLEVTENITPNVNSGMTLNLETNQTTAQSPSQDLDGSIPGVRDNQTPPTPIVVRTLNLNATSSSQSGEVETQNNELRIVLSIYHPPSHYEDRSQIFVSASSSSTAHPDLIPLATTSSPILAAKSYHTTLSNRNGVSNPQPTRLSTLPDLRRDSDSSSDNRRSRLFSSSMDNSPPHLNRKHIKEGRQPHPRESSYVLSQMEQESVDSTISGEHHPGRVIDDPSNRSRRRFESSESSDGNDEIQSFDSAVNHFESLR